MTHGVGQIAHGTAHIMVHLKMSLSELIHPLLHRDLLMSHLQSLVFGRRNHNDSPPLSGRPCPHARTRPNVSHARVFTLRPLGMTLVAQGIQFAHTHKTYAKTSAQRQSATDRLTFGATLLAMLDGHTSLHPLLLEVTTFPGLLCSLPALFLSHSPGPCSLSLLMRVLDLLTLLPPLVRLHNTHVITSVGFQHGLIGHPQSKIAFVRLAREQKLLHSFVFIVASHVEEVRKK